MCSREYRTAQPCDIPWVPDEDGLCNVLIEDRINETGPSRTIFSVYVDSVSFVSFVITSIRIQALWIQLQQRATSKLAGQHRLYIFAFSPAIRFYAFMAFAMALEVRI